jgi:hypothetical protein
MREHRAALPAPHGAKREQVATMKKMPCVFARDFHGKNSFTMRNEPTPECDWVFRGEGVATRKFDGTACMVLGGELYKRYDAKQRKLPPPGAIPCDEPDPVTGHHPHWVRVSEVPEDQWHLCAWFRQGFHIKQPPFGPPIDGTYELCGPHFSANPEGLPCDLFLPHGAESYENVPRTFDGLKTFLREHVIEGLVFHGPEGQMAKVRRADFGLPWPALPMNGGWPLSFRPAMSAVK